MNIGKKGYKQVATCLAQNVNNGLFRFTECFENAYTNTKTQKGVKNICKQAPGRLKTYLKPCLYWLLPQLNHVFDLLPNRCETKS